MSSDFIIYLTVHIKLDFSQNPQINCQKSPILLENLLDLANNNLKQRKPTIFSNEFLKNLLNIYRQRYYLELKTLQILSQSIEASAISVCLIENNGNFGLKNNYKITKFFN